MDSYVKNGEVIIGWEMPLSELMIDSRASDYLIDTFDDDNIDISSTKYLEFFDYVKEERPVKYYKIIKGNFKLIKKQFMFPLYKDKDQINYNNCFDCKEQKEFEQDGNNMVEDPHHKIKLMYDYFRILKVEL